VREGWPADAGVLEQGGRNRPGLRGRLIPHG
jgi:hypothetical protein